MTNNRQLVLVSEAYSASNIGDLELVQRSLRYAARYSAQSSVVCLAVDPTSFAPHVPVMVTDRLFPRLQYVRSGRLRKIAVMARWMARITMLSTVALLIPKRMRRRAVINLRRARLTTSSAELYARATSVIAVGGGYLGDQYVKESLLTFWTWWWASRIGNDVETMPLSFEVSGFILKRAAQTLTRRVKWRTRDRASAAALYSAGINSILAPDLAFANSRETRTEGRRGTLIALVGSDYLKPTEIDRLTDAMADAVASGVPASSPVQLLSMHAPMSDTRVGGDDRASEILENKLRLRGVQSERVSAYTYDEVCDACEKVDVVISARMHAGIAALCVGARTGLLAYEEKHTALMNDLGLGNFVTDIRSPDALIRKLVDEVRGAEREVFVDAAGEYAKRLHSLGLSY